MIAALAGAFLLFLICGFHTFETFILALGLDEAAGQDGTQTAVVQIIESLDNFLSGFVLLYFALLPTGMAIAGGGAKVTSVLANGWPEWVIALLSGIFILVGFIIMIASLQKYIFIANKVVVTDEINIISPRLLRKICLSSR